MNELEKEGMPIFLDDSEELQESLHIWKEETGEVKSESNIRRKEYWDHISTCRSL